MDNRLKKNLSTGRTDRHHDSVRAAAEDSLASSQ